jgi:hypothetical protein
VQASLSKKEVSLASIDASDHFRLAVFAHFDGAPLSSIIRRGVLETRISSKRLKMPPTRWGYRKSKSCPRLNKQRFSSSPTVADTVRLAAFLASDGAATLIGAIVNASGGAVID